MKHTAFYPADILLPKDIDYKKWAVVACDQYTSEPEYWRVTDEIVGSAPSTLKITLPEIYLEQDGVDAKIAKINENMQQMLAKDLFACYKNALIYVKRVQSDGKLREGLVGAVDLEEYDYKKGSKSQIRATEATVAERIPPRLKIRENAPLELPHIMILIDDAEKTVIEPLAQKNLRQVYATELMQNGGEISGYLVDESSANEIENALAKLGETTEMLFAMGDGNHSLATAKEHYEHLKKLHPETDFTNHPARYALCEIVNLHSEALEFEAIHRIVTETDTEKLLSEMKETLALSTEPSEQKIKVVLGDKEEVLFVHKPLSKLAVGSLQIFLDKYLAENKGKIDYIHGEDVIQSLASGENAVGFVLEPMQKSELFPAVIADGALPRKTFSMGHAADKRYYLEAKRIVE